MCPAKLHIAYTMFYEIIFTLGHCHKLGVNYTVSRNGQYNQAMTENGSKLSNIPFWKAGPRNTWIPE